MKKLEDTRITIVGAGYVGMSLAVLLAQKNHVTIIDINAEKIDKIRKGISPIKDEYIEAYMQEKALKISATVDDKKAFSSADYIVISTPTDYDISKEYFNTDSVEDVLARIISINEKAVIVIRSTVPVGYTLEICKKYSWRKIIFCPEFLRESKALYDNLFPSRIVIGHKAEHKRDAELFALLLKNAALKEDVPLLFMGTTEAEAVKLFSNTYLALRVAFFNELDTYAESQGLNTYQIINGICKDPRIGDYYNNPSFGYGGYCLPKDTKQLLANYKDIPENIISAIVDSNETRKNYIAEQILEKVKDYNLVMHQQKEKIKEKCVIGIYRLTMKCKSDNFRQSSILGIISRLKGRVDDIVIYEPTLEISSYEDLVIINDLRIFKEYSTIIVANRYDDNLCDVMDKVYTRDLFERD